LSDEFCTQILSNGISTVVPCILKQLQFYHQLMQKRIALKGILKFTLQQIQHVLV